MSTATTTTVQIPPLTTEEEDQIALNRITNDERPLKRITKKLQAHFTLQRDKTLSPDYEKVLKEARDAVLAELDGFQLALRKNVMVCEAEARQVREYEQERLRIDDEYGTLRGQIEQLKTSLDHAQTERKRKMEYDQIADKANLFPSRQELESAIESLETDMSLIRTEHELQDRTMRSQKAAVDALVKEIAKVRFLGKEQGDVPSSPGSPLPVDAEDTAPEDGEEVSSLPPTTATTDNDIEMGEVEETGTKSPAKGKKKLKEEELEEGEATDSSSALSDPPDSD